MKTAVPPPPTILHRGFTLVELAIVMFIVALLLGGMLLPLSAQQDVRSQGETQKQLAEAREALLGFAIAKGRLPCPASATSNGQESFCDSASGACVVTPPFQYQPHGRCSNPHDGFLPAATLGIAPVDTQGFAVDAWSGNPINRIRYAVTTASTSTGNPITDNTNAFTKGMKTVIMTELAPDLKVCNTGTGMVSPGTASADCAANASLASDAVAVVYSLGKNAGTGGTGADENHNPNPQSTIATDRAFVSAQPGQNFDDQMIWLSKNILFNRMVSAGQLP